MIQSLQCSGATHRGQTRTPIFQPWLLGLLRRPRSLHGIAIRLDSRGLRAPSPLTDHERVAGE